MDKFNLRNLFVFDMANNHQGDLEHGLNIVKAMGNVCRETGIRAALKFQFRQLDTFIHPDFKDKKDIKHIPRFMSTALSMKDYDILADEVRKQNMVTMSTPFDEESVDLIIKQDLDIIKVASCSAFDKPLLDRIASSGRPVIISTAGLSLKQIDWLVSFFEARSVNFAIMHCVALYPTPNNKLNLNQINLLKARYPDIPIGFSTHEDPDNYDAVKIAYAKGAELFERHVGLITDKYKLNAYSSTQKHIFNWINAYKVAVDTCGGEERSPASPDEIASLNSLQRGVYAKKQIKSGDKISKEDVFFAMPYQNNQLASGNWIEGIVADKDYQKNEPVCKNVVTPDDSPENIIYGIMLQVKGMLNKARIFINSDSSIEISHHYGLERFREFGAVIINCINREYCKKLVIQLPRQKHPYHYHSKKEETFQLLYGDMEVEHEGKKYRLKPGDTFLVERKEWHKFHTLDGAIFEEVSTTHFDNDSFYEDEKISGFSRQKRKTNVDSWAKALHWRY